MCSAQEIHIPTATILRAFWEYFSSEECNATKDGPCRFDMIVSPCVPEFCIYVGMFESVLADQGPGPYRKDEILSAAHIFFSPDCAARFYAPEQDGEYCEHLKTRGKEGECRGENCHKALQIWEKARSQLGGG